MRYIKIGNTHFDTERLAFKNKREFLEIYSNLLLAKDLDEAWKTLKVYIKVEPKPKDERSKVEPKYKKDERE